MSLSFTDNKGTVQSQQLNTYHSFRSILSTNFACDSTFKGLGLQQDHFFESWSPSNELNEKEVEF